MQRDPCVAIAVHNAEQPYQQAMIRGRAIEVTAEVAGADIDKLAKKYLGLDEFPYRQPGEQRLIVKVAADKVGLMVASGSSFVPARRPTRADQPIDSTGESVARSGLARA